jgi:glycosyltransferase involved in cell wall biosynthesis
MKVVLAVHHFPPRYRGGAEQNVLGLARNLAARGDEVRVVCVESLREDGGVEVAGADERYQGLPVSRLRVSRAAADFAASYAHAGIGEWMERYLRRERPDIVHLHSGYLLTGAVVDAAARAGVPAVVTLHDYWFLCPRTTLLRPGRGPCDVPERAAECAWCLALDKRRFRLAAVAPGAAWSLGASLARRPWARWVGIAPDGEDIHKRRVALRGVLDKAAAVLVPTRFLRAVFVAAGFPAKRFEWVPLGVDLPPLVPSPRRCAGPRFAYAGQLAPHKGVDDLLAAWAILAGAAAAPRLTVYGDLTADPAYARRLRALAAANPAVEFAGPFERAQLGEVLAAADAVVVPSVWYENSSQTVMEALAAGVPVLASRIGALPELVEEGIDGLLFAPRDPMDLARAVRSVVDQPGLLQGLRGSLRPPRGGAAEASDVAAIYARVSSRG